MNAPDPGERSVSQALSCAEPEGPQRGETPEPTRGLLPSGLKPVLLALFPREPVRTRQGPGRWKAELVFPLQSSQHPSFLFPSSSPFLASLPGPFQFVQIPSGVSLEPGRPRFLLDFGHAVVKPLPAPGLSFL